MAQENDGQRVVLVKPGDVLLIGNVGEVEPEQVDAICKAFEATGIKRVFVFTEDIDLDLLPSQ